MKNSDKNKVFQFLKDLSFPINDFKISETNEEVPQNPLSAIPATIIKYKDTSLQFEISNPFDTFEQYRYRYTMFGPNFRWTHYLPVNQVGYFVDVNAGLKVWLSEHVEAYIKEMAEPDLWNDYLKIPRSIKFDGASGFDKSKFVETEKQQLRLALNDLKILITEKFAETELQVGLVSDNINYLAEKIDDLNKFDWRSVAISVIVNISTSLLLDPSKALIIWNWFVNLISSIPHIQP